MYIVIRAGGMGMRLWPLSRPDCPKQFQKVLSSKTLFRETVERLLLLELDATHIFVSCNKSHRRIVQEEAPEIPADNIIAEPALRNTGPAMCLETAVLKTRIPGDEVVLSVPSDDYVRNGDAYRAAMHQVAEVIKDNPAWVYTPCTLPLSPDCGYSYVRAGEELAPLQCGVLCSVGEWIEKPDAQTCAKIIATPSLGVHIGMYMYVLDTMYELWGEYHPAMRAVCDDVALNLSGAIPRYEQLPSLTVERMLTSISSSVVMNVLRDIGWSDVGKWHAVRRILQPQGGNAVRGHARVKDTTNTLISTHKGKTVITIGIDNMVIVDTPDALLVSVADRSHEVKEILEREHPH